jgi:hypothetical protein
MCLAPSTWRDTIVNVAIWLMNGARVTQRVFEPSLRLDDRRDG